MLDREKIDREYRRQRLIHLLKTGAAVVFAAVAWGLVAYLAYEIPSKARREYDVLIRDYEWRRAQLEMPYRQLQEELRQ